MAADRAQRGRGIREPIREPIGDRGVVDAGAGIGLGGELAPQRERRRAAVLPKLGQHDGVVRGIDHDRHVGMVLGRGADHGGTADVDVLDAGFEIGALGDGCFERIEADDEEIDRRDAVRTHGGGVIRVVADGEQAAMDLGMQRLHPAVHHFGEAGHLGDFEHGKAGVRQRLARAPGRDELHSLRRQRTRELDDARLVGNGNEGARDAAEAFGHDRTSVPIPKFASPRSAL